MWTSPLRGHVAMEKLQTAMEEAYNWRARDVMVPVRNMFVEQVLPESVEDFIPRRPACWTIIWHTKHKRRLHEVVHGLRIRTSGSQNGITSAGPGVAQGQKSTLLIAERAVTQGLERKCTFLVKFHWTVRSISTTHEKSAKAS
jgi:hypothetical protein